MKIERFKIGLYLVFEFIWEPISSFIFKKYYDFKRFLMSETIKIFLCIFLFIIVCAIFCLILFFPIGNNENYSLVLSQILSGIIAGAFTFIGVTFTIIRQDKIIAEDRRLAIKPYLVLWDGNENDVSIIKKNMDFQLTYEDECMDFEELKKYDFDKTEWVAQINPFIVHNSDFAECIFIGIRYKGKTISLNNKILFRKNSQYKIDFQYIYFIFNADRPIYGIHGMPITELVFEDMQGNRYYYFLDFNEHIIEIEELEQFTKGLIPRENKIVTGTVYTLTQPLFSYSEKVSKEDIDRGELIEFSFWESVGRIMHLNEYIGQVSSISSTKSIAEKIHDRKVMERIFLDVFGRIKKKRIRDIIDKQE